MSHRAPTALLLFLVLSAAAQEPAQRVTDGARLPEPAVATAAATPRLMKFAGALKNIDGSARSGVHGVTFALYRDQEGGSPIWLETLNAEVDSEGRYTALLGSTKSEGLPLELFATGEARWLGIRGQMPWDEEQRVLLVSVPYALKALDAETLGGKPLSAFVLAEPAGERSAPGAVNALAVAASELPQPSNASSGTPGYIAMFINNTDQGNSVMYQNAGKIGVNTTSPISTLHVQTASSSDYITLAAYQVDMFDKGFLVRSAPGTPAAPLAVANGNVLFNLYAQGHDGTDYGIAGGMRMEVEGAVSTGIVPGVVSFHTTNAAGAFLERMRISSAGNVGIGVTSPTQKLEVAGTIKSTTGGFIFPDGTVQTTAAGSLAFDKPDDVRLFISRQQQQIERLQAELLELRATFEQFRAASPR